MKQEREFTEVIKMIQASRVNAFQAVNKELINLYWSIGEYISKRVESQVWGKSVVVKLAAYITSNTPDLKGYSDKNLWRMKQFYETYKAHPKLSTLLREISWSHNLAIFSRCKTMEEREFYLLRCKNERYGVRELDRQISSGLFERSLIGNAKLSTVLREISQPANGSFKDSYVFEFLSLPPDHSEIELQRALVIQMKDFVLELGKDFVFMGQEFRLQVGNSDFEIDLLFYHRDLQCLVAIELKIDKFKPEYLGQLNFYLEALDRDVKKPHEKPSIGILLCKDRDHDVVRYAMNRSLSPAMVAEYELKLPDKSTLYRKLQCVGSE
ncbi:PDDEXK nuclease domain-containing protein [Paraflavitalea sp. CAU 1676]|uniref:PDDEXK nuclease domain-containing protein n=1 Tax=Paraflavitalea sp. CAU 1676 TaxID=3032598 RepID=UPI0023DCEB1E|nr:PDDEXK nuclease domain-containing protein [Paraflavitalea sp. CAU 1676]MDF2191398.1 PDDEXK nuclease domain-containing protein [Paraflavitalea sp. CAU 1676]